MSDRYCIRGCTVRGEHYAACQLSGSDYEGEFPCTGCAPREARLGVLICVGCYGRARRLIGDVYDLLGRLDSLADPMKATPMDRQRVSGGSVEPSAPIEDDVLDAIRDVSHTLVAWAELTGRRTIDEAFDDIANDREDITRFGEGWMDRAVVVDGIRDFWTVADAMTKWGPERRTKGEPEWEPDEVLDPMTDKPRPVAEWDDEFLTRAEAAKVAGTVRTLQRWCKAGEVSKLTIYIAGVRTVMYRLSELRAAEMKKPGRPRATEPKEPNR